MQGEFDKHSEGKLELVTTILARPTRLVKGKSVAGEIEEALFETEQEAALLAAANKASEQVHPDMGISEFIEVSVSDFSHPQCRIV